MTHTTPLLGQPRTIRNQDTSSLQAASRSIRATQACPAARWVQETRHRPDNAGAIVASTSHPKRVKNTARTLHGKALSSLRTAMTAFNSPHDDGRTTTVLLHLQHAFEMLLKAALSQSGAKTFDKRTGRSIGFEAAVNQARQLASVKLTEDEAALLRAIGTGTGGGPILLRVERVGASGSAVEFAEGGTVGGGVEFGPPERPWVTCLRVELPATAVDATTWAVRDVDCPTFAAAVRKDAARVHAGDFTSDPLLRPPCYGTTGYCPGG